MLFKSSIRKLECLEYDYIQNKLKRRREDEMGLRIDLLSIRKSFMLHIHPETQSELR